MTHPHLHWTFDAAQLIPVGLWVVIYLRRFIHAREEAGGRGAGPLQLVAFIGSVLGLETSTTMLGLVTWVGESFARSSGSQTTLTSA